MNLSDTIAILTRSIENNEAVSSITASLDQKIPISTVVSSALLKEVVRFLLEIQRRRKSQPNLTVPHPLDDSGERTH